MYIMYYICTQYLLYLILLHYRKGYYFISFFHLIMQVQHAYSTTSMSEYYCLVEK